MDDSNRRVKLVREESGLSQKGFAEKMGFSRDVISNIEYGRTDVKEYVAKAICREFKINYLWLMEGSGNPHNNITENIFDEIQKEYNLDEDDVSLLKEYSELDSDQRNRLKDYIKSLISVEKKK
ncbi:helix-turn-helix domain-containing protein [uncultured Robinsoniella sp.]|uniref:helix-turn-helix domain-containing protein n=1 Tax=uncultured Robinsoniella sp. TaxID=904190 RepID=UPI0029062B58|nr:helix-turn-helix transcriptional regulator [Clostridiales bacterium]